MTKSNQSELLFWAHIDDGDYEGAVKHVLTPTEQVRVSAERYLAEAVERGEVTQSHIYMNHQLGKYAGYTTVETNSGVEIRKDSQGHMHISTEYEERKRGSAPGDYQDVEVEIELPVDDKAVVYEHRRKVVDHDHTGDRGSKTLSRVAAEQAMGQVTKLIWRVFD